jgi:hypothetical protein
MERNTHHVCDKGCKRRENKMTRGKSNRFTKVTCQTYSIIKNENIWLLQKCQMCSRIVPELHAGTCSVLYRQIINQVSDSIDCQY